jgi:histidyl-tRNA synthetase
MEAAGLFDAMEQAVGGVLVCAMDASCEVFGAGVARALRVKGFTAEMYPGTPKLKKQLDYANDKKMGFAVIIGNEELQANKVALKNLVSGEQVTGSVEEISAFIAATI